MAPTNEKELEELKEAVVEAAKVVAETKAKSQQETEAVPDLVLRTEAVIKTLQDIIDLQIEGPLAQRVFEAEIYGVVIVDDEGIIRVVNDLAERMFGYEEKELLGKDLTMLMPDRFKDRHNAKQEAYFKNPGPRLFRELAGRRKDGTEFPIDIALHPLESFTGHKMVLALLK